MGSSSSVRDNIVPHSRDLTRFDRAKLFRVFQKTIRLLGKKCSSEEEAFVVSVMLVCCFEDVFGVHLGEGGWLEVRRLVKENMSSVG